MSDKRKPKGPFYIIGTGTGLAIRDKKNGCVGTLTFRPWVKDKDHTLADSIADQLRRGEIDTPTAEINK